MVACEHTNEAHSTAAAFMNCVAFKVIKIKYWLKVIVVRFIILWINRVLGMQI